MKITKKTVRLHFLHRITYIEHNTNINCYAQIARHTIQYSVSYLLALQMSSVIFS